MNLNELKAKRPAKHAEYLQALKDLKAAHDQVRPLNHECGTAWAAVEKAQAAYKKKREETAALERRLRVPDLSKRLASLAREIKGL
jgi:hypothetical protein